VLRPSVLALDELVHDTEREKFDVVVGWTSTEWYVRTPSSGLLSEFGRVCAEPN